MMTLVAHPFAPVAEGMATALAEEFDLSTSTATTLDAAWRAIADHEVDLAVVDAGLAPDHAADVCHRWAQSGVRTVIVVRPGTSAHLQLLEQGAAGIAVATDGLAGVLLAVGTVLDGHVHVPPHLLGTVLNELIVQRRQIEPMAAGRLGQLSPREREVLGLLGRGWDTREIAARLVISPNTAKTHINRILGKLGLSSRTEAARFAIAYGVEPSPVEASSG